MKTLLLQKYFYLKLMAYLFLNNLIKNRNFRFQTQNHFGSTHQQIDFHERF